ncbi:beta-1,4-N-acetylgalactosaminyltransferase bre-4-like [Babylonia areolata]|uniref:beta-1,4-N-acetylgalactosaminyltransferase bre-4-like n=1 Tax=Babylonia areolata TaxID=304850 RepID=UPI003FD41D57
MSKGCSKLRLFNLLVLTGAINILIFRNYFMGALRHSVSNRNNNDDNDNDDAATTSGGNNTTSASTHVRRFSPTTGTFSTRAGVNVTQGGGGGGGGGGGVGGGGGGPPPVLHPGAGPVLEAWNRAVKPRADVTAPWVQGSNASAPLCPLVPPLLVGQLKTYSDAPNLTEIVRLNPGLEPGGHYRPSSCRARHRVAVVVPYRDREKHLRVMLHNLHPMLIRQQLDYFVLVVELAQPTTFNRGLLLNIGAVEALGLWDVGCFVFHDVDLVPENDRNLYTCPEMPRHMSAAVDKFNYKLPYAGILGGVAAMTREHFYRMNGYSNLYFGWGGEDDDLSGRVKAVGLTVRRYALNVARYRMIKHNRDKKNEPNPKRFDMLKNFKTRQPVDGLNSLQYQVQKVEFRPAYTWILVSVNQTLYTGVGGKN